MTIGLLCLVQQVADHMRTSDVAKRFGVHPNTVRLYEEWGYLPPIPRDQRGQRVFTEQHAEQMRFARITLHEAPACGPQLKESYKELVWLASAGDFEFAAVHARKHLTMVQSARERANNALAFLQVDLPKQVAQQAELPLYIRQAASFVDVSVPVVRRWETHELIQVPRHPRNNYRLYGKNEVGWLLVICSLRQAGYKVSHCKRLIKQHQKASDAAKSHNVTGKGLCDVMAKCCSLFSAHEKHMNAVLDQLHKLAGAVHPL